MTDITKHEPSSMALSGFEVGSNGDVIGHVTSGFDGYFELNESDARALAEHFGMSAQPTASVEEWRLDSEDLEALHMALDSHNAPRHEGERELSAYGRVLHLLPRWMTREEFESAPYLSEIAAHIVFAGGVEPAVIRKTDAGYVYRHAFGTYGKHAITHVQPTPTPEPPK